MAVRCCDHVDVDQHDCASECDAKQQADIVKGLHTRLREEIHSDQDHEVVWSRLLTDEECLDDYSHAMYRLATKYWNDGKREASRILWCVETIEEYFRFDRALHKLLLKDLRRRDHSMATLVSLPLLPITPEQVVEVVQQFCLPYALLDVGSCYNPFGIYEQLNVTAIDIAPANQSVLKCDFLSVSIVDKSSHHVHDVLCTDNYDVVVFSLLLSYFPLPQQRMECCIRAHRLLKLHGLLLVITPDSSHQNRHASMMKTWKMCIEAIGFHRWRYVKGKHLHHMAFRKTTCAHSDYSEHNSCQLSIPQDKHCKSDIITTTHDSSSDINDLSQLPFFED